MTDLVDAKPKRKRLRLKLEKPAGVAQEAPRYLQPEISVYMVWCPDGYLPKKVYAADEQELAIYHAKKLADTTGRRFYVMRSWRGYSGEKEEAAGEGM